MHVMSRSRTNIINDMELPFLLAGLPDIENVGVRVLNPSEMYKYLNNQSINQSIKAKTRYTCNYVRLQEKL